MSEGIKFWLQTFVLGEVDSSNSSLQLRTRRSLQAPTNDQGPCRLHDGRDLMPTECVCIYLPVLVRL